MSEPRRSTRARAREEAAAAPPPEPADTPSKPAPKSLKRKRPTAAAKDATPVQPAVETSHEISKPSLPIRLIEGQPLPTLSEPQPLDLPSTEYQDVRQSGVLSASLRQSRATWISGKNFRLFHAFFTPPKKVADRTDEDKQAMQRQKDITRNFPQLGGQMEARLVIEPHTFPIRLYGPREYVRQAQRKPPQYGQWPNHNQYPPYQQHQHNQAPQIQQPHLPHQSHQSQQTQGPYQQPQHHQPYNNPSTSYAKPTPPPPPPRPKQPPKPPAPASTTAAPDPVIHLLAQRAGTDPELKAVMKIVAAGQATQEQLSFFQGHISELTTMLEKQKAAAAKAAPRPPPPPPTPAPRSQQPPPTIPYQPAQAPATSQGYHPQQQHQPKPYTPPMTPAPQQHVPPQPRPTPHPNQYTYNQPQYHAAPQNAPPPPRTSYRPLVFDFVEGNGDKFYFPSYSIMEWLPNNQGVKFSFLATKLKPKPKEEPKQEAKPNVPSTPALKQDKAPATLPVPPTPTPSAVPQTPGAPQPQPQPNPNQNTPANPQNPQSQPQAQTPASAQPAPAPTPSTPQYVPPPRIEDFDEKKDLKEVDLYTPVTFVIHSTNPEILQSLPRAVRPPDTVVKYMDEVFDECKRAEETYLAFRLPKEGDGGAKDGGDAMVGLEGPGAGIVGVGMGNGVEKKRAAARGRNSVV